MYKDCNLTDLQLDYWLSLSTKPEHAKINFTIFLPAALDYQEKVLKAKKNYTNCKKVCSLTLTFEITLNYFRYCCKFNSYNNLT